MEKRKSFKVEISPHIKSDITTRRIMWEVTLSLLPASIAGVYFFGLHAFFVILTSIAVSVLSEYIYLKIRKKKVDLLDGSAFLTGLLLALCLPPKFPLWATALGAFFGIIFGKQIFGGLGWNIFNPALVGRVFLASSFPKLMTVYFDPIDGITKATPLAMWKFSNILTSKKLLLIGNIGGSIGETSKILLLLGALFLILRRHITLRIPLSYILTVFVFSGIFYILNSSKYPDPLWQILSGGLIIGAFFMATDPVTTPVTKSGRIVFGIGCGIIVVVIRLFGGLPEGVMHSILIMNAFTPLINKFTKPRRFGT